MKIVEEIRKSPGLMKAVDRSGRRTRKAFDALVAFMGSPQFRDIMGRMRNKLTFHYDPKIVESALASLVAKHPDAAGSVSLGDEPHNWYFEPGWATARPCARHSRCQTAPMSSRRRTKSSCSFMASLRCSAGSPPALFGRTQNRRDKSRRNKMNDGRISHSEAAAIRQPLDRLRGQLQER
jgi:hypothetical protein